MTKKITFCFLLLTIFLSGCTDKKVIKDYKKFAAIYVDILIVQEKNKGNYQAINKERSKVYQRYGIDDEQFRTTIQYYNQDGERWGEFFGEVNKRIQKLKKPVNRKST